MANKTLPSVRRGLAAVGGAVSRIAAELSSSTPEIARALPSAKGGEVQGQLQTYRADMFTFFTRPGPAQLLYAAENWVRVVITLTTAGPVAIGVKPDLGPVLSGAGLILQTNVPVTMTLPRATRLYIISGAANAISVLIEPIPWLEQISTEIRAVIGALRGMFHRGAEAAPAGPTHAGAPAAAPVATPPAGPLPRLPSHAGSGLPVPPLRRRR